MNNSNSYIEQAQKLAKKHQLPMKFLHFKSKGWEDAPTFYFACGQRLDFRELVKDLNKLLNQKIMLVQVSNREAAAVLGGIGPCGRELCCKNWLKSPIEDANQCTGSGTGYCGKNYCCCLYERDDFKAPCAQQLISSLKADEEEIAKDTPNIVSDKEKEEAVKTTSEGGEKKKHPIKKVTRKLVKPSKKRKK